MPLVVKKAEGDFYEAYATQPHIKEDWVTPYPISLRELVNELQKRGCHQQDNFEYGVTGAAAGYSSIFLQGAADFIHGGDNNLINTIDIQAGIDAISRGGTLGTTEYTPPSLNQNCQVGR